jgi:hypothetical protein
VEVGWRVLYQESVVYKAQNTKKKKVQKAVLVTRKTESYNFFKISNDKLRKLI